ALVSCVGSSPGYPMVSEGTGSSIVSPGSVSWSVPYGDISGAPWGVLKVRKPNAAIKAAGNTENRNDLLFFGAEFFFFMTLNFGFTMRTDLLKPATTGNYAKTLP